MNIDTEHKHVAFELRLSAEAKSKLRELLVPVWLIRRSPIFTFVKVENSDDRRANPFTAKRWQFHSIANCKNAILQAASDSLPFVLNGTIRFQKEILPSTYLRRYEQTLRNMPQISVDDIPKRVLGCVGFKFYGQNQKSEMQRDFERLVTLLKSWTHSSEERANYANELVRHLYRTSIFICQAKYQHIHSERLYRYQIEFDATNCSPVDTELTLFLMALLTDVNIQYANSVEFNQLLDERIPALTTKPVRKVQ